MSESTRSESEKFVAHSAAFYVHSALLFAAALATSLLLVLSALPQETASSSAFHFALAWVVGAGLWAAAARRFYCEDKRHLESLLGKQSVAPVARPHLRLVKSDG